MGEHWLRAKICAIALSGVFISGPAVAQTIFPPTYHQACGTVESAELCTVFIPDQPFMGCDRFMIQDPGPPLYPGTHIWIGGTWTPAELSICMSGCGFLYVTNSGPCVCCHVRTGNVDNDGQDRIDISDLSALIGYCYLGMPAPVCMPAANCDGSADGNIDIGDLAALIDYLYISFTPTAACQ